MKDYTIKKKWWILQYSDDEVNKQWNIKMDVSFC